MTFDKNDLQYLPDIEIVQPTVLPTLPRTVKAFYFNTKFTRTLQLNYITNFKPYDDITRTINVSLMVKLFLSKYISPNPNLLSYKILFSVFVLFKSPFRVHWTLFEVIIILNDLCIFCSIYATLIKKLSFRDLLSCSIRRDVFHIYI